MYFIKLFSIFSCIPFVFGTIERPRGVSISKASLYAPNAERVFSCIDGSRKIPYQHLNDDYCDCADGSDEPGTSACPQATFHCTNAGYLPKDIKSSRVNDGVCDCCDGTDEYSGNIQCINNCKELGKQLREEREEKKRLQELGHKKKVEFTEQGKKTLEEKKKKIQELEKEKEELEEQIKGLEEKKNEAEGPEKEAKEKFEKDWEETKAQKQAAKDLLKAKEAFEALDTDKDGKVSTAEIMARPEFDIDSDGTVSEEEAKEHLEEAEGADLEHFMSKMWSNIKSIYKEPTSEGDKPEEGETRGEEDIPPPPPDTTKDIDSSLPPPLDAGDEDDDDADHDEDDHDDDDDYEEKYTEAAEEAIPAHPTDAIPTPDPITPDLVTPKMEIVKKDEESNTDDDEKMPDYDEDIKALIATADEARKNYNDADARKKEIEREISSMTTYLNTDFGPEFEFAVLRETCFEYTDREYTYKLCPFINASQHPKSGGGETSLGTWGKWDGTPENSYSAQKYENGQSCWNGPNRSVKVYFHCGQEHQLTNAYEPSRCEYAFDFNTPCVCSTPAAEEKLADHDEL